MRTRTIAMMMGLLGITVACLASPGSRLSQSDQVATSVAATLQSVSALTPTVAATQAAQHATGVLPHPLYYETKDSHGHQQVFRLDTDGHTVTQLTSESADVDDYDVSPIDGSLAYVSNNQLLQAKPDGSGRTVLFDGGPMSVNPNGGDPAFAQQRVSNPRWSPDGGTLAFGHDGLNFYELASGKMTNVLTNQVETNGGVTTLKEGYSPALYSPDGSKLLLNLLYYEGSSYAIYDIASKTLTPLKQPDGGMICCAPIWSADGSTIYTANDLLGYFDPGLWRFSAADGSGTTLLSGTAADGSNNFAEAPFPLPDGTLQFFFANQNGMSGAHVPEKLVHSGPDGVANRTPLRLDVFEINGALWKPDGSAVVILQAPDDKTWTSGAAILVPASGAPVTPLVPDATNLRWGP